MIFVPKPPLLLVLAAIIIIIIIIIILPTTYLWFTRRKYWIFFFPWKLVVYLRAFSYTKTSFFSAPSCQKVCLKSFTLSASPVALVKLSDNFTHDTQVPSGLFTLFGLITTENEPNGQKFSFSFGNVPLVLFDKLVPIPNGSHHNFSEFSGGVETHGVCGGVGRWSKNPFVSSLRPGSKASKS